MRTKESGIQPLRIEIEGHEKKMDGRVEDQRGRSVIIVIGRVSLLRYPGTPDVGVPGYRRQKIFKCLLGTFPELRFQK
jgi:hypothetical protein